MKIKGTGTEFLFKKKILSLKIDNNTVFNSGSGSKLGQNSGSGFKFNVFGSTKLFTTMSFLILFPILVNVNA